MASLPNLGIWLRRNRFTVGLCGAIVIAALAGGFSDRGGPRNPWLPNVPILRPGCPMTGCECVDDCLASAFGPSGGSGSTGSYGLSNYSTGAPVSFERNLGQTDGRYTFIAQGA